MNQIKQEMALFKFKIIAPVVTESSIVKKDYFLQASQKTYELPGGDKRKYSAKTFKKWLHIYTKHGFDGLISMHRKDKGSFRKIPDELLGKITQLLNTYHFRTVQNLYDYLISEGIIQPDMFTYATLNNAIKSSNLRAKVPCNKERKSFETEHINSLWMADFMYGPYIRKGKNKVRSYLCCIIDDHSRYIVGAGFYDTQSNYAFECTLKKAIATFGVPNRLYTDNGKVFLQGHLSVIAAKVGFVLIHSKPYDSASRGKIERFFRTVRDTFLPLFMIKESKNSLSLDDINRGLHKWLEEKYHKKFHKGIKMTPYDRYVKSRNKTTIRVLHSPDIDDAFLHIEYRKVRADSTIMLHNKYYEVPPLFIGKKIEIRYDIDLPDVYTVYENNKPVCKATVLDKNYNASHPIRFDDEDMEGANV